MPLELSPVEVRILGCLLEKERHTPENYPLSLNALLGACNQSTSRDPVVAYDEKTVEHGLDTLREKKLALMLWSAGSRVPKYRHDLLAHYELSPPEVAVLCVLLLRGPQTPGELRARTERLHLFPSVEDVQNGLDDLVLGDDPLVCMLPHRPGQKECRYAHLLGGPVDVDAAAPPPAPAPVAPSRLDAFEAEVAALKAELAGLREEFAGFKRQFE
jgi:uncharacterized protein YceH (UPF0502 family)